MLMAACGLVETPPSQNDIYNAIKAMPEQPFNIEGVTCKSTGADAYDCQYSASIVAGYVPGYVGDLRPDYKIVQMKGRFSRAGPTWTVAQASIIGGM